LLAIALKIPEMSPVNKTLQFVAPDPEKAMTMFNAGLRRAVKISPAKMDGLVEQDNARREAERAERGHAKRGPKPKA
jgi:hypothetical protein